MKCSQESLSRSPTAAAVSSRTERMMRYAGEFSSAFKSLRMVIGSATPNLSKSPSNCRPSEVSRATPGRSEMYARYASSAETSRCCARSSDASVTVVSTPGRVPMYLRCAALPARTRAASGLLKLSLTTRLLDDM